MAPRDTLLAEITSSLPDNTTGLITPLSVRTLESHIVGGLSYIEIPIEKFGGKADYDPVTGLGTDNLPAMNAAIASLSATFDPSFPYYRAGAKIVLGYGHYYFSGPIVPDRTVTIEGVGTSLANGGFQTQVHVAAGQSFLVVNGWTNPGGVVTAGASFTALRNMQILSKGKAGETTKHGIDAHCQVTLENIQVNGFGGHGISIYADAAHFGGGSNANLASIVQCWSINNAGSGLYLHGGDANVVYVLQFNGTGNGAWGIEDDSFLGNTFIGCHADSNVSGPYKCSGPNADSVFVGCYVEGGQPPSNITKPSAIFGGPLSYAANNGNALTVSGNYISSFSVRGASDDTADLFYGLRQGNNSITQLVAPGGIYPIDFRWDPTTNSYGNQYANVANWGEYLTTDVSTIQCGRGAAIPPNSNVFTKGLFLGPPGAFNTNLARFIGFDTAAPTSGTYAQGDKIFNSAPTAGGSEGWVCVTGGTPGTWKTFGSIAA